jgi:signal transduction histidine kinase
MISEVIIFNLLLIMGFLNLVLGAIILFHGSRNIQNIFYSLLIFSIFSWCIGIVGFYSEYRSNFDWIAVTHISALMVAFSFSFFSFLFPKKIISYGKLKKIFLILLIPLLLSSYFILFTDYIIGEIIDINYELKGGYLFYQLLVFLYFSTGFLFLFKQFLIASNKPQKKQIVLVFSGSLFSAFFATITNLILPWIGVFSLTWLGPVFTIFLVLSITYAIIQHQLFNIKVVTTEILIFALWVILAFKTVTADSPQDFFISGFILMATIFIGVFLIRSVTKEVHQREEIEKLAARVEKANERLRKVDKIKTEFMSIVSHQLRTPLSIVKGHLSMIQEGLYDKEPEKKAKILNDVYEANERLIGLVNDVLNASRIQSGRVEISKEKADITKVIKDVVEKLMPSAKEKGLKMIFHEPEKQIPKINIDVSKVENILINFIDNAIKYTNDGSVEVYLHQEEDGVVISIKDTGDGMNQEELEKLFETFSRGGAGKKYWIQGAGLGLYIARRFVEMHGGKTWAESEGKGKGSSFYIKLPI